MSRREASIEDFADVGQEHEKPGLTCGVFCNVMRYECSNCGRYASICVTHGGEPTRHNRCRCVTMPAGEHGSSGITGDESDG